jgi:hypothetical protein
VILLFDIHFAPNQFVKAGAGQAGDAWEPRSRPVIHKISRLLETTEAKFNESFGVFSSKHEAESRMVDLARMLYKIAFEWLNERINEALDIHARTMVELRVNTIRQTAVTKDPVKVLRTRLEPKYKITILDFPGYTSENSLGAFSTNVAIEALNYYCS